VPATIPSRSEPLLYTIPEAATALRVSRTKLYELLDSGEIESIHIGRSRKIPAEALRTYIDRLRRARACEHRPD
jgi:excisionase family DNA binding protein